MPKPKLDYMVKPEVLQQLGRIVVEFQGLEGGIQFFAQFLLSIPQRFAWIVFAELSFKNLCHLTSALCRELHGSRPEAKRAMKTLQEALALEQERNKMLHSRWMGSGRMKTTAKHSHGIRFTFEGLDQMDIDGLADRINACALEFQELSLVFARDGLDMANSLPAWSKRAEQAAHASKTGR